MSSALKPVLTTGGTQNPPVSPQVTKTVHSQPPPATYGQPATYNISNVPNNTTHTSPVNAHSSTTHHTTHPNHYSLTVPTTQHFTGANTALAIPISNHPVASASQAQFTPNKSPVSTGGYQPNLGHPPNVVPPVSQSLTATNVAESEKPQSNGTPEVKNHVSPQKEKPLPSPVPMLETRVAVEAKEEGASCAVEAAVNSSNVPANVPAIVVAATPVVASNAVSVSVEEVKTSPVAVEQGPKSEGAAQVPESPTAVVKSKETTPQKPPPSPSKSTPTVRQPSKRAKAKEEESPKSSKSELKAVKAPINIGKRIRTQTQPYQSPIPEIELISKMANWVEKGPKNSDEKLIVFYKNEFLAVRNLEGGFYVCQTVQNIYKSSPKIKIRWLSQDKVDKTGEIYTPDFYDHTDFDCILTNLNLIRVDKGKFKLPNSEKIRTDNILKRAIAVEKGDATPPSPTEEHPDGLDVSLYTEESQINKRKYRKRKAGSRSRSPRKRKAPEPPQVQKASPKPPPPAKKKPVAAKKPVEVRRAAVSRAERAAKRRSTETAPAKTSPVVDQKKAKVLAKVVRKVVAKNQPRGSKAVKVGPVVAVVKKKVPVGVKKQMNTRKTKRPLRK